MCKTFMIGAMKPVSLLFDQPTYNGEESSMLHTMFRGDRQAGSGEEDV